jgi:hypothetical protein
MSVLLATFIVSNLYSKECKVPHEIMYAIASVESHEKKEIGYPYLISFNDINDYKKISYILDDFKFTSMRDNRTIDCLSESNCIAIADRLILNGIENIDMGAYQICYYWNKNIKLNIAFNLIKSYLFACNKVYSHIKEKNDDSISTIARYHSKTPSLNQAYAKKLEKKLKINYPEQFN